MLEYQTIQGPAEDRFTEKKSEFIGRISPVSTEQDALAFIEGIRRENREARHHVYAYRLRNGVTRCSDDGEPQGTGGVPVLNVLQKEELIDVCLVVTRYFGGILLGGGGLTRAYSHGAALAVAAASRLVMTPCAVLRRRVAYPLYGKVTFLLPRFGVKVLQSDFGEDVILELAVREDRREGLCGQLTELSGGSAEIVLKEEVYLDEREVEPQS